MPLSWYLIVFWSKLVYSWSFMLRPIKSKNKGYREKFENERCMIYSDFLSIFPIHIFLFCFSRQNLSYKITKNMQPWVPNISIYLLFLPLFCFSFFLFRTRIFLKISIFTHLWLFRDLSCLTLCLPIWRLSLLCLSCLLWVCDLWICLDICLKKRVKTWV